jgi:lipoprotein-anchoring transpeptidase ErfK/SrfK
MFDRDVGGMDIRLSSPAFSKSRTEEMKRFAGCMALAILWIGSPVVAGDAVDQPAAAATERPAAGAPAPEGGGAAQASTNSDAQPASNSNAATSPAAASAPAAETADPAPAAAPVADPTPPAPPAPPPITLVLNTDLRAQRLTVIENGKTRYAWPISSGRRGFATPTGTFHPQWASRMWHSRQYEYAPMPHAVFFHRGTAFHGTGATGLLGQPASHGCVRLAPGNAATLFRMVHKHGYASTKVVVHGGSKSREPAVARRGSRGELASARTDGRSGYRTGRRSSYWED